MKQEDFLDILQKMIADGIITQDDAVKYFPELTEDEDEQIRKELIDFFSNKDEEDYANMHSRKDILDWLNSLRPQPQKKELIDKAVTWLNEHKVFVETEDNGIAGWIPDSLIDEFKKYMKEKV